MGGGGGKAKGGAPKGVHGGCSAKCRKSVGRGGAVGKSSPRNRDAAEERVRGFSAALIVCYWDCLSITLGCFSQTFHCSYY